jgi:hypothetical protein
MSRIMLDSSYDFFRAMLLATSLAAASLGIANGGLDKNAPPTETPAPATVSADPLANTPTVAAGVSGRDAGREIEHMLPARTDSPFDWNAGLEPLHFCGEPRWLRPCIPPPPCHPSCPPQPFDLIGEDGLPTDGPRYRGPCCPRTGTHDDGPFPHVHRIHDRAFDWFYRTK